MGAGADALAGDDAVATDVGRHRAGNQVARHVVAGIDQRTLVGAGGEHDAAGAHLVHAGTGLAATIGERGDAIVIGTILLVNAVIGTFQEGRAERSMLALRKLAALRTRVLRDGEERDVAAADVVPGDLLLLAAGDAVPADARILDGSRIEAVEAVLTGESQPLRLTPAAEDRPLEECANLAFAGTLVAYGQGLGVIVATGERTELGCISAYWGDENSGARRRYYTITPLGRQTYEQLFADWKTAKKLIDKLIVTEEAKNE